jgi:proline iminopeptidase
VTLDDMVADVEAVRQLQQAERVAILAHGTGGLVGLAYARRFPSRARALILVNAIARACDVGARLREMRQNAPPALADALSQAESEGIFHQREYRPAYWEVARALLDYYQRPFRTLGEFRFAHFADSFSWDTYRALWKPHGEFEIAGAWDTLDLVGDLQGIEIPSLIVVGAYDPIAVEQAELLAANLPMAQRLTFSRSGHYPFLEEPDRFLRTVRSFLSTRDLVDAIACRTPVCREAELTSAEAVVSQLRSVLDHSPALRLVTGNDRDRARFVATPEISEKDGTLMLALRARDSGTTPSEVLLVERVEKRTEVANGLQRLAQRFCAWAGELPEQLAERLPRPLENSSPAEPVRPPSC